MGQYYIAYVRNNKANVIRKYHPHDYDCGLKLMENAFMLSPVVLSVLKDIHHAPKSVAWEGDYMSITMTAENAQRNIKFHDAILLPASKEKIEGFREMKDFAGAYLINHTKKEFVNYKNWVAKNARVEMYEYTNADGNHVKGADIYCLDPLPILTAMGNGNGGGDYRGANMEEVGRWAMDEIEFNYLSECCDPKYNGYKEICPKFVDEYFDK